MEIDIRDYLESYLMDSSKRFLRARASVFQFAPDYAECKIRFSVNPDGRIENITMLQRSEFPDFDFDGFEAIKRASPLRQLQQRITILCTVRRFGFDLQVEEPLELKEFAFISEEPKFPKPEPEAAIDVEQLKVPGALVQKYLEKLDKDLEKAYERWKSSALLEDRRTKAHFMRYEYTDKFTRETKERYASKRLQEYIDFAKQDDPPT
jgi:TonB family protein